MTSAATHALPAGTGTYPPIEINAERQIRVLSLAPSMSIDRHPAIYGELSIVDLPTSSSSRHGSGSSSVLDFDALSYAWGSKVGQVPIYLNGSKGHILVTMNPYFALRSLRFRKWPRDIWIDQICINQANMQERNRQIRLMETIYRSASQVVVWLGYGRGGKLSYSREDDLQVLMKETSHSWWERTWIVQEVALARRDPLVMFDYHISDWQWLVSGGRYARKDVLASSAHSFREGHFHSASDKTFLSVLGTVRRTTSTDPRDKVYAVLSLVDSSIRSYIRPDYSKSVAEVFAEATHASIAASGTLDLLLFSCKSITGKERLPPVPSWAFDFGAEDVRFWSKCSTPVVSRFKPHSEVLNCRPFGYTSRMLDRIEPTPWETTRLPLEGLNIVDTEEDGRTKAPLTFSCWTDAIAHLTFNFPYEALLNPNKPTTAHAAVLKCLRQFFSEAPDSRHAICQLFDEWHSVLRSRHNLEPPQPDQKPLDLERWLQYLQLSIFITKSGFVGFGHSSSYIEPQIFSPNGGLAPVVWAAPTHSQRIMDYQGSKTWQLCGFAHVNGIMGGELQAPGMAERIDEVDVVLV
ncbi:hypothetical protein M409DRAFT_57702 [Zasmidium cellare ATCC 36951]|uniref:Heterokaryon incompatibility domain-containing protein n=1 Tax=Zasmidium cellare ATCC 36951 TaxID=1080233 RepID=A0A6A6CAT4_ZASCE|nr:uncharacterized protein M409DRAFT_57702 [Zasmidium cellare ATCC 36951]KAF2163022.1 hypothetical protein M409DRAFT_57702 [Zasmidium cellare ATCC 36951]